MKQDRQGVRQAADLERKYDLGAESKALSIATDAKAAAERAIASVGSLNAGIKKNAEDITALDESVQELSKKIDGGTSAFLSVVDGKLCITYEEEEA